MSTHKERWNGLFSSWQDKKHNNFVDEVFDNVAHASHALRSSLKQASISGNQKRAILKAVLSCCSYRKDFGLSRCHFFAAACTAFSGEQEKLSSLLQGSKLSVEMFLEKIDINSNVKVRKQMALELNKKDNASRQKAVAEKHLLNIKKSKKIPNASIPELLKFIEDNHIFTWASMVDSVDINKDSLRFLFYVGSIDPHHLFFRRRISINPAAKQKKANVTLDNISPGVRKSTLFTALTNSSYALVSDYFERHGIHNRKKAAQHFGVSENAMRNRLREKGVLFTDLAVTRAIKKGMAEKPLLAARPPVKTL